MINERNVDVLGKVGGVGEDLAVEIPAFSWPKVLRLVRSVILNYNFKLFEKGTV